MVVMNLGVVALPVIELRKFAMKCARAVLRHLDVLRRAIRVRLRNEPAATPAYAEAAADEVLPLFICVKYSAVTVHSS